MVNGGRHARDGPRQRPSTTLAKAARDSTGHLARPSGTYTRMTGQASSFSARWGTISFTSRRTGAARRPDSDQLSEVERELQALAQGRVVQVAAQQLAQLLHPV